MVYYTVMAHGRKVAEFKPLPFSVFILKQVSYIHIYNMNCTTVSNV